MKRTMLLSAALIFVIAPQGQAAQRYEAEGLVLKVDHLHNALLISCGDIPGYMNAATKQFGVRDAEELSGVDVGSMVEFTVVVEKERSHVENIRLHRYESVEQDPLTARRLRMLASIVNPAAAPQTLHIGEQVPIFCCSIRTDRTSRLRSFPEKSWPSRSPTRTVRCRAFVFASPTVSANCKSVLQNNSGAN
jgi:Cu/Ag efflux protein CusF